MSMIAVMLPLVARAEMRTDLRRLTSRRAHSCSSNQGAAILDLPDGQIVSSGKCYRRRRRTHPTKRRPQWPVSIPEQSRAPSYHSVVATVATHAGLRSFRPCCSLAMSPTSVSKGAGGVIIVNNNVKSSCPVWR